MCLPSLGARSGGQSGCSRGWEEAMRSGRQQGQMGQKVISRTLVECEMGAAGGLWAESDMV